jgi:hypothetical protein
LREKKFGRLEPVAIPVIDSNNLLKNVFPDLINDANMTYGDSSD